MIFDEHIRIHNEHAPHVYANFVSTIDGKTAVRDKKGSDYWPLGSALDYDLLTELRLRADVLVHGARTAEFCRTLDRIGSRSFQNRRKALGITAPLVYCVLSNTPTTRLQHLLAYPPEGTEVYLTSVQDMRSLITHLSTHFKAKRILLEGGPTLMGSFLKEHCVNELYLTIAPKIFGTHSGKTLTLAEDVFFTADTVVSTTLISCITAENEVFLRYSL